VQSGVQDVPDERILTGPKNSDRVTEKRTDRLERRKSESHIEIWSDTHPYIHTYIQE
jgi:hypothetical protein